MELSRYYPILSILLLCMIRQAVEGTVDPLPDLVNQRGHLKPFGEQGVNLHVEELSYFPDAYDFMVNYVHKSKPVKFAGVIKNSVPVAHWTDDYLLALDIPEDSVVHLETVKKETRTQDVVEMHFHEFLRKYNETEYYMVDTIPAYLRPDVFIPCSLQCKELLAEGLDNALMWFSSGDTKSVIHTDSYENINCMVRGHKIFILADSKRDRSKITLNRKGSHSDIDVDSVDLVKYPAVADMEFYNVTVQAGDCLYIPYKWIHQVRSFDSNLAINFWWDYYITKHLADGEGTFCEGHCDPTLPLDKVKLRAETAEDSLSSPEAIKDWCEEAVIDEPLRADNFMKFMAEVSEVEDTLKLQELFMEMFQKLDWNQDGLLSVVDIPQVTMETWQELLDKITSLFEEQRDQERREYAEYLAAQRKEEL